MNYYCDGNLNKAMLYCDKVLAVNREHSPTLNLKGLICYIKGDLESAQMNWKINYKINGDGVSKNYLEDSKNDKNKLYLYSQGVLFFNEVKVRKALECFVECENSHFNSINLWSYIALSYMKLGDYDNCIKYMEQILSVDRNNSIALEINKQLQDIKIIKKQIPWKSIKITTIVLVIALILFSTSVFIYSKRSHIRNIFSTRSQIEKVDEESTNNSNFQGNIIGNSKDESEKYEENNNSNEKKAEFNKEVVTGLLKNKKYEEIYDYIETVDIEELSINEKVVVEDAKVVIMEEGVNYFYEEASKLIHENNYDKSLNFLKKAYKYSEKSYLKEHILYMLGFSSEKIGDIENSNKYYEEYAKIYIKDGVYIEQCLYNLSINNEKIDIDKSKKYSKILKENFAKSEFNNTKIKEILNK